MTETKPVLIAGAGPAGLAAALCLADKDVPVRLFEAEPALTVDLRAGTFHPPTLEMLAPYGLTDRMLARGIKVRKWQIRDREAGLLAEWDLGLLANDTPYTFRLQFEQHKLTPMMLEKLGDYPHCTVQFASRVAAIEQTGDGVRITVERDGETEQHDGSYLIGCDGHRSVVRDSMGVEFEGFTWPEMFLIVSTPYDFSPHGYAGATYIADPDEWVMLFNVPGFEPPPLWRIALPADPSKPPDEIMDLDVVQRRLQGFHRIDSDYEIVHRNAYRVHQRVASSFNAGRVLIAGDASHVNNPLGGMGLNGGVHDAMNLSDKLARLWRGEAGPEILDLYTRQRRQTQIEFVQRITIENKRLVEMRDPEIRRQRQDEIRRRGEDPDLAYKYLLDSSMIAMVRKVATIT